MRGDLISGLLLERLADATERSYDQLQQRWGTTKISDTTSLFVAGQGVGSGPSSGDARRAPAPESWLRRRAQWIEDRVVLAASNVADRPSDARIRVLVVAGVAAVGFGIWGWLVYLGQHPEEDIGFLAVVHGLWALFSAGGDIQSVPWPLAVARVLAPLVTAGFVVEVALSAGAVRLRRSVARRSFDHIVVVATSARVTPAAYAGEAAGARVIHVGTEGDPLVEGAISIRDDGSSDGWISMTNSEQAKLVVLASDCDSRTLQMLTAALHQSVPAPGAKVIAEVEDPNLALQISVLLAATVPGVDVEVVCVEECRAALVGTKILEQFTRALGFDDSRPPAEQDSVINDLDEVLTRGGPSALDVPVVAVLGDGAMSRLLVDRLVADLTALDNLTGRRIFALAVVDPDGVTSHPAAVSPEARAPDTTTDRGVVSVTDIATWRQPDRLLASIDYADPDETARRTVDLTSSRPRAQIWVAGENPILPDTPHRGPGEPPWTAPVLLSHEAVASAQRLVGPFTSVAQARNAEAAARRSGSAHGAPAGGDHGHDVAAEWTPAMVRSAVQVLHGCGWDVVPRTRLANAGLPELDSGTRQRLAEATGAGFADVGQLVRALSHVRLTVRRSATGAASQGVK